LGRVSRSLVVVLVMAISAPALGSPSRWSEGCTGALLTGGKASCSTLFVVPHFTPRDSIDYASLVARVTSPQAMSWRVSGSIRDGRGVVYFAWTCTAARSSVVMGSATYVQRSCSASRKTVTVKRNGRTYRQYYTANTIAPQTMTVTSQVGMCAPACRFEGAATYLISR